MKTSPTIRICTTATTALAPTSTFRGPRGLLLIGRLVAIVVLLLPTGRSDGAEQHPAGLEEGDQEGLLGLGPGPPNYSRRLGIDATSFKENEG